MTPQRPLKGWYTVKEMVARFRFPSDKACRHWLYRHQVPVIKRGRIVLADGVDIDRILRSAGNRCGYGKVA